jgi:hypothetical protein
MPPLNVVEFEVPTVRVLEPRATIESATPLRSWIVWAPLLPETSKPAVASVRFTPVDAAMLPAPVSTSAPPLMVVAPL